MSFRIKWISHIFIERCLSEKGILEKELSKKSSSLIDLKKDHDDREDYFDQSFNPS